MSAGTPVLAARAPGVVEVCGDAARYVDPREPAELAAALAELAAEAPLRRDLAERGRRRAAEFSWRRSARLHVEAYTLAAGHEGRDPRHARHPRLLQRLRDGRRAAGLAR